MASHNFFKDSIGYFVLRQAKSILRKLRLIGLVWNSTLLASAVVSFPRNIRLWRASAEDGQLIPPLKCIAAVTGSCDVKWFLESGKLALRSIAEALNRNGLQMDDFQKILDFGCGCGRVIRHLGKKYKGQIYGTDMNSQLVMWSDQNLRFASFGKNGLSPPLKHLDETFDFVFALSVFTHLSEPLQVSWIKELSRVLRQGGYLLITTHSARDIEGRLSEAETARFNRGHLIVHGEDLTGTNLCTAYHPMEFIREKLISGFSLIDFVEEGAKGNPFQNLFLLRKLQ